MNQRFKLAFTASLLLIAFPILANTLDPIRFPDLQQEIAECKSKPSGNLLKSLYETYLNEQSELVEGRTRYKEGMGLQISAALGSNGISYFGVLSKNTIKDFDLSKFYESYLSSNQPQEVEKTNSSLDGFEITKMFPEATKVITFCTSAMLNPRVPTGPKLVRTFSKIHILLTDNNPLAIFRYELEQDQTDKTLFRVLDAWSIDQTNSFIQLIGTRTKL